MKISSIGIGFLAAGLFCGGARAAETQYAVGARALPTTQQGATARALGMGSAVVAVDQGSASLLWNPAGLSHMTCSEVGVHHTSGLGGTVQETFVFGTPLGEVAEGSKGGSMGGLAASFGYTDYGSFEGADVNNVATGYYGSHDYNASVGWGKELVPNLSAGVTLKGASSSFGGQSYNTVATDVGLLWSATPALNLGVSYSNLDFTGGVSGARVAGGLRLGAGWKESSRWLLSAATELQDAGVKRFQFGTEYLIGDVEKGANVLALRGGYVASFPNADLGVLNGLSMGLGFAISRQLAVDYAFLPVGDLGNTHRLSLTFKFGCPHHEVSQKAAVAAPTAKAAAAAPVVVVAVPLADSHFDFDKSNLKPSAKKILDEHIQYMKDHPNTTARVSGYSSAMGAPEYNQKLSERRAESVKAYLVAGGVQPSRISAIGYGEGQPAANEAAPEQARSAAAKSNMRVLFEILSDGN